ncbi:M10 family metallopeptidase [soil metagenome]
MTITNVTTQQARDGLLSGAKWFGSTITYSVPGAGALWQAGYEDGEPFNANYSTFSATQAANFRGVMAVWDSYIAPAISEVSDSSPGQIRAAITDVTGLSGNPNIAAYAYGPPVGAEQPVHGDVWVDESFAGNPFAARTFGFELLLHEVGHSLGLKHPFETPTLPAGYDFKTYSIMSYTAEDSFFNWSGGGGNISYNYSDTVDYTPMVLDILAIQSHYGADTATGAGNTVYTFTNADLNGRQAIYDASGIDTINLSALARGSSVDLRPGAYSDLAYYNVNAQIADLTATFGAGFETFIRNAMTDLTAYEWERNLGISFSTVIENVIGSANSDTIIANTAGNVITAGGGNDSVLALEGDDYLYGGQGSDTLDGGTGVDYARYDDANYGNLFISLANPASNTGAAAGDIFLGIEGIIGGAGSDTITGDGAQNYLFGLDGGDYLQGGFGGDLMYGGTGLDYARYDNANYGNLVISLAKPASNTGAAAGDHFNNIEGIIGGVGADTITGDAAKNYLFGLDGDDQLAGGLGGDVLYGGLGIDFIRFDDGNYGNFTVSLANQALNTGVAAGDSYGNIEGIIGGAGNEVILGNGSQNFLFGQGGNDTFVGGLGNDVISVGTGGADYVRFNTALGVTNVDTVMGFAVVNDTIQLSRSIFTAFTSTGYLSALEPGAFNTGAAASQADDHIIYNPGNGALIYDTNGNVGGGATQFATLAAGLALTAADFMII